MKNNIKYILSLLIIALFLSCNDDSIQQRRDAEKAKRLNYVRENKIPDSARQISGLYFISLKEGEGELPQWSKDKVYVYYTFYNLDGTVLKTNTLAGYFEPLSFVYGDQTVKQALNEAVGQMKEGGKARLIIPSSLNNGTPFLGVEITSTNQFVTVICDLELFEIRESKDPNLEF